MMALELDWLEPFLADYRRRGSSPKTVYRYGMVLRSLNDYHINLRTVTETALLEHIDTYQQNHAPATNRLHIFLIRKALEFLDRKDLAANVKLPKRADPVASVKTIPAEDRKQLIEKAPTLQDRLLIEILDETGARIGELGNLRIKDCQFDEYSGILSLTGKTGTRRRRVYASTPDLRNHLNNHHGRDNPESAVFYNPKTGKAYEYWDYYRRIRWLGHKVLKTDISPHKFRHSRATEDSRNFTDREMMQLFGWKRPDMVAVYSHLSMRDVDNKDLILHGLKSRDEILRPLVQVQHCEKCNEENAPLAIFCVKCGETETRIETVLKDQKFIQGLVSNPEFLAALKKALES
jgi:integrase/ribosomal protein L40E